MIEISSRGQNMPASPIRKLVPFADKAKEKGIKVLHLNIGQPDIETPKEMMDVLKSINIPVLEYSPSQGFLSYRKKLAEYYKRNRLELTPDEIIVTVGGSEALYFAIMSVLDSGEEMIIPEPFYANYNGFATASGVKIVSVSSNIESGFALPKIQEFENKITDKTRAILICNPNNPTGYLYSQDELETLREICLKHNLFLISDEAYREFCYDEKQHFSAMELEGMDQHCILVDTVSKRYSACGARIGAIVSKNKALMSTALKFAQARLSPPSIEQYLSEAAVDLPKDYFEKTKSEYQNRRDALVKGLNTIPGVICPNPGGAFYIMAELPIHDAENFCQWMLEDFSYEGYTVMMAPATGFYSNSELGKNQVRLAYVLELSLIEKAVECLRKGIESFNSLHK